MALCTPDITVTERDPKNDTGICRLLTTCSIATVTNEGQKEPVGDVDVRLFPLHQCAHVEREERDPDDGQPKVGQPLGLGVFPGPWVEPSR